MEKVKIGIVEDDKIVSTNIRILLDELGYEATLASTNYEDGIEMIKAQNPDLVMLDIQLDGEKDGIDLAETINKDFKIPFIFLTSNSDKYTIERAKKVNPHSYLIKPCNKENLYSAIEVSLYNFSGETRPMEGMDSYVNKQHVFIKDGYYFHKVRIDEIYYMESDHVYINIYTTQKKLIVRASLNKYIENFSADTFFRPHRSYAINVNHIEKINSKFVLINGVKIPITRQKKEELLTRLKLVKPA